MEESKEKVQARLREVLDERPDASTDELQDEARQVDPSLGSLSRRQFNAGYVLPVKRERAPADRPKPPRAPRGSKKKAARRGKKAQTAAAAAAPEEGSRRRRRGRGAEAETPAAPASGSAPTGGERERVREILLRFARDLTAAESRSQIIDVLGSLDSYADDVLKAAR
jgi:hypothetical protein